jgi:hypothetical protein
MPTFIMLNQEPTNSCEMVLRHDEKYSYNVGITASECGMIAMSCGPAVRANQHSPCVGAVHGPREMAV